MKSIRVSIAVPIGVGLAVISSAAEFSKPSALATQPVDFTKDIQPIFATRCYDCHGPKKQEAQFRLDMKESALKGGDLGLAIVPGHSADSLLIQAVSGLKADLVMPRRGERLTIQQIGLLRAWIDQGAVWPENASVAADDARNHWAFKAPVRPVLPVAKNKKWARNPIDTFVLARLEKEGLSPSPEADRATLLRRLNLDLLGLPPTLSEIKDFLADRRPDAYERVVERLLASPHYGERWGRHWLDLARYADSNGYEKDKPRSIWPYRDWVVAALNRDLPYDQFTIEQMAGDLLPKTTLDQRIATGFLRNSMLNQEGGIEPEQFRVEALIDRMDTIGKTFLGLTINCCQCHDHKYDPFAQKEYYQLYAFLNNDDEAFVEVPTAAQKKNRKEIQAKVNELELVAMKESTNLTERMEAWEKTLTPATSNWTVLEPKDWQNFATKFEKQDDGSLLGGGDLQPGGVMRVWTETQLTNITGLRLELLTNPNLMYGGPGLLGKGSVFVKEFEAEAYAAENPTVTNKIKFTRALADLEAPGFSITNTIDGKTDKGGWTPTTTIDQRNRQHCAVFECETPFGFPGGTRLLVTISQKHDKDVPVEASMLGCFRLSATTEPLPLQVDPLSTEQRKVLAIPQASRSEADQVKLFDLFRRSDSTLTNLNQEIGKLWTEWPNSPTTMVLQQRKVPRVTHIFKRGDRLRPTDEVESEVPSVLNPFPAGAPRNRLGLARWMVATNSPTTARVMVNRLWQSYFGQGLVTSPEDFGTRVDKPSHPELLDWLACEFMQPSVWNDEIRMIPQSGNERNPKSKTQTALDSSKPWSLKHIHQLIVTSATYRQSSKVTPALYAKDPYNRLLARGPRFRVEGEVVQDIALSVSGLLNPKIGGPSVYPPIPASVGDTVYGGFSWTETKGDDRYRRGMYTFAKRSLPFPSLTAFDAPSGETSCPRRVRSNTPLQALTTLNEKTYVEAAQAMALRVMKEGGADEKTRIDYAFELCTGRPPSNLESTRLLAFWREQYDYFENRTSAAVTVAVPDPKQLPTDVNLHKAAAWMMVSRALLNLDETVTKE